MDNSRLKRGLVSTVLITCALVASAGCTLFEGEGTDTQTEEQIGQTNQDDGQGSETAEDTSEDSSTDDTSAGEQTVDETDDTTADDEVPNTNENTPDDEIVEERTEAEQKATEETGYTPPSGVPRIDTPIPITSDQFGRLDMHSGKLQNILDELRSPLATYETVWTQDDGDTQILTAEQILTDSSDNPTARVSTRIILTYLQMRWGLLEDEELTSDEIDEMVMIYPDQDKGFHRQMVYFAYDLTRIHSYYGYLQFYGGLPEGMTVTRTIEDVLYAWDETIDVDLFVTTYNQYFGAEL